LPYPLNFIDVNEAAQILQITDELSIQAHPLSHRVPSFAFSIIAQYTQKKLDTQALIQLGVAKGKVWGDLQQGLDVQLNEQTLKAADFIQTQTQRVHAIVGGDNDSPELLAQACQDAQLLIHESTYTQAILDKVGSGPMHSSAKWLNLHNNKSKQSHSDAFQSTSSGSNWTKSNADEVHQYYQGNFYLADDFDQFSLDMTGQLTKIDKS
jgi:ribonuclease Z